MRRTHKMIFKQYKYENPNQLNNEQLWLIATSAMLAQLNLERHDTLHPVDERSKEAIEDISRCLDRDWGIKKKKDLLSTISDLQSNNETFMAAQKSWECVSEVELRAVDKFSARYQNTKNIFAMVGYYQFNLQAGDLAWHLGRAAWLIRQGAFLNLITEEEAWALLAKNGELVKKNFNSWEEFGISYAVGAQYWRQNQWGEASISRYKQHLKYLLTNQDSPWNHVLF